MSVTKEYLLIFDWDGVIVDSAGYYLDVYKKICNKYNKPFHLNTAEEFRDWYDSAWENNFYRLGFRKEDIPEILAYEERIVNYDDIYFFPDIREILVELKKEYNMAIASTTPSFKIRQRLINEKSDDVFSMISGGEDGASEKKTKIFKVIQHFNIAPEKCIMFGDTVMDIVSSKTLGMRCIAIACGWNSRKRLEDASPYLIVDRHEEILSSVHNIFARGDA